MTLSVDISRVEKVTQELNEILELLNRDRDRSKEITITTNNGRIYKVANVLETKDGSWLITDLVSRGMFICNHCDNPPKNHIGDSYIQVFHNANVIRLHSSFIHFFKEHPKVVSQGLLIRIS
jgi:hypothetical protein